MFANELVDCARCYAPAVEVVTLIVNREELELDLCAEHLEKLLESGPPIGSAMRSAQRGLSRNVNSE